MRRLDFDTLMEFGTRLLTAKGVAEADARYVTEVAIRTHAFGITTHGLPVISSLGNTLGKSTDPKARPDIVKETDAAACIHGRGGIGHLTVKLACELAEKKAREQGVALITVTGISWIAAIGMHLLPLAEKGFLAEAWTQTSSCADAAPYGGIDAKLSTNPVAFAFPTDREPAVIDFSTTTYSMGKVGKMIREGQQAPEPLFLDKDGQLTCDPSVVREGGSILPFGGDRFGFRGYGMSLWIEALTAMAGGSCNNPDVPISQTFILTVMEPDHFGGREYYKKEMTRFIAHLLDNRVRPGFEGIRIPGARGHAAMRAAKKDGIPVEDYLFEKLQALAREAGISPLPEDS